VALFTWIKRDTFTLATKTQQLAWDNEAVAAYQQAGQSQLSLIAAASLD